MMLADSSPVLVVAETLGGVEFFHGLDAEQRRAVAHLCHGHRYVRGEEIISHNEEETDVFFIVSGNVHITIYSLAGKEVTFRDLGAGQMFGELAAIDGRPRSAHVVAMTDTLIASMSSENFWKVLREYPPVTAVLLCQLSTLVRELSDRVVEFSTLGVRNRIHAELLRLARAHMCEENVAAISPAPTHAAIASRVSTHREAVTRDFNELTRAGLLERRDGTLLVRDVARLARMVKDVRGK